MRIFHYTLNQSLKGIFHSGKIARSISILRGERPCVWLTSNDDFEFINGKLNKFETVNESQIDIIANFGVLPIRIEINTDTIEVITWETYRKQIPLWVAMNYETASNHTSEWHICLIDIPVECIRLPIENWNGAEWVPYYKYHQLGRK